MPLNLPERASYEFLKKLAKERLAVLRSRDPEARLAAAQLDVARQYGFSSWRALKTEIDHRRAPNVAEFVRACTAGDVDALRQLLQSDPSLARERVAGGATGLHLAARHPEALRLLLEHGADPNVRDTGDNASALHVAAANRNLESVRLLLDAGADVHGEGDLHEGGVIGWATARGNEAVIDYLLERGARHHIFSAMALGDRALVERLVEEDPGQLSRRRSRFENRHTPVHAAFVRPDGVGYLAGQPDYAMLSLLVELGADVNAPDDKGRTPMELAMLSGDREAIRILTAAGAAAPAQPPKAVEAEGVASLAGSVKKGEPMFRVPDMRATVRWYQGIGFKLLDHYEDGDELTFARLGLGRCEFGLSPGSPTGPRDVSLWLITDRIEELYTRLKGQQLRAVADGSADLVRFESDLYTPFYGGREFGIQDINGLSLVFWQPD